MGKDKELYVVFVDLEKASDKVPRKAIQWSIRKLGNDKLIVRSNYGNVQIMDIWSGVWEADKEI